MGLSDDDCVRFLKDCLPQLGLRWEGFRKVHRTVCKRLKRRMRELHISRFDGYRAYLGEHPGERERIDSFCRIPISRFYRDRSAFEALERDIVPALAEAALREGRDRIRIWSLGCASGEEAYSLSIVWRTALAPRFPALDVDILATDVDETMIARARRGCYARGSLRELPRDCRDMGFERRDDLFCVRAVFRDAVTFELADVRRAQPPGPFDLICCRNVIFTYFAPDLQAELCHVLHGLLHADGILVLGKDERLPQAQELFDPVGKDVPLYRKRAP